MHAAPVLPEDRFRHEGGVNAILRGDFLDRQAVSHRIIGHSQRVRIAHVDLMLGRGDFVMAVFDHDPQFSQCEDRFPPEIRGHIERRQVKITAFIQDLGALENS